MHGIYDGKPYGFFSVRDWLDSVIMSFPAPWSLLPLEGKYYGTVIQDGSGKPILSFWDGTGDPSERQKAYFGDDWTPEAWADYCCDCHWESASALAMAETAIEVRNQFDANGWIGELPDRLTLTILEKAEWKEDIWPNLLCGGPNRRALRPELAEKLAGIDVWSQ